MGKYYNALYEQYELMEVNDELTVLFTNSRIDRDTVPPTLFCYDVRETDGGSGDPASIELFVLVNHWGTIISKTEIPMNENNYYDIEDYSYLGVSDFTIDEYVATDDFSEYF